MKRKNDFTDINKMVLAEEQIFQRKKKLAKLFYNIARGEGKLTYIDIGNKFCIKRRKPYVFTILSANRISLARIKTARKHLKTKIEKQIFWLFSCYPNLSEFGKFALNNLTNQLNKLNNKKY